jgi:hypothetical protein
MKPAPASHLLAVAAAVCAVAVLGACKTVRTEKWSKGSVATSKYERRMDDTVRKTYKELEALSSGDDTADFTHSQYDNQTDIKKKSSLFGKKYVGEKSYRTKDFAGAEEYKDGDYHFLKRKEYDSKTSSDQNQVFDTGESPDERKKFFGRRKKARTKDYADNNKLIRSNNYRDTEDDIGRLNQSSPNIIRDDAEEAGATLTVDDVRTMLHGAE